MIICELMIPFNPILNFSEINIIYEQKDEKRES